MQRKNRFTGPRGGELRETLLVGLALLALVVLIPERLSANPRGGTVAGGTASFEQTGNTLNIRTSDRAIINWQQFNIAPNETTRFIQPNSNSFALNRILDSNPSTIFGALQANGNIVLLNRSGIIFGPDAKVNVHGLVATSLSIDDREFMDGKFKFIGHDQNGAVKNFGSIDTVTGGFAYLLAPNVENNGIIRSPEGHIALAAGTKAYLSNRPDGRGLLVEVEAPAGKAINLRDLIADGGRVDLYGRAVNQSGLVQANTVENRNGEIHLVASNRVYMGEESRTVARGAGEGVSKGGSVTAISGGGTGGAQAGADLVFNKGAVIDVSGGAGGGDGGAAELSASGGMVLEGEVRGEAADGYAGGELLIDPVSVTIGNAAPNGSPNVDPPGTGTVAFDSPTLPANLFLNTTTSFSGLSIIRVEATRDISIVSAWNLQPQVNELTLRAGNDILFGTGARISALNSGAGFNANLVAGADFAAGGLLAAVPGVGIIRNALVEIGDGKITALAGNAINLQDGAIRTTKGGSIEMTALQGDINAGRNAAFLQQAGSIALRLPTGGVGGIGTQAGGDIVLNAPNGEISSSFTHIGAYSFGTGATGNVTMRAKDFTGHFLVFQGAADVRLTGDFGKGIRTTTIDLANGSTAYVEAANVRLGQIRNPQGALGLLHFFNYGNAGVELVATSGNVVLAGDAGAGNNDGINVNRILAPNLTARSLQGDILIGNDFVLFPSPTANLVMEAFGDITNNFPILEPVRTDSLPPDPFASNFNSAPTMAAATGNSGINQVFPVIVLSDADPFRINPPVPAGPVPVVPDLRKNLFAYYATQHTPAPLHTGDPEPVRISTVEGDLSRVGFNLSKPADFDIGGDVRNIVFDGQNITPDDVTSFNIKGNLDWRQIIEDVDGFPVLVNGNSRDPLSTVIRQGGPGTLEINVEGFADLGETEGIQSVGTLFNRNLDDNSPGVPDNDLADNGANIRMRVGPEVLGGQGTPVLTPKGFVNRQDLVMVNSRIATFGGGSIDITVNNGSLIVGAGTIGLTDSSLPRGIYTAVGGGINLLASKNVDVLTSRVGAFDGGDINIKAVKGSINAGEGRLDQPATVPSVGENGVAFEVSGTGIITSSSSPNKNPGAINLKAGQEVRTGSAGITCSGANASACNVTITGNVTLGPGGITSGGNVSISGNVSGVGNITGGSVNISGSAAGANITASSGSGAVSSAAAGATTTTETSLVAKAATDVSGGGDEDDEDKKKPKGKRKYIRRGVIIEVIGKPAA